MQKTQPSITGAVLLYFTHAFRRLLPSNLRLNRTFWALAEHLTHQIVSDFFFFYWKPCRCDICDVSPGLPLSAGRTAALEANNPESPRRSCWFPDRSRCPSVCFGETHSLRRDKGSLVARKEGILPLISNAMVFLLLQKIFRLC